LPIATDDHQTQNASVMVKLGAARLIQERDLSAERLSAIISQLIADRATLLTMAQAARAVRITDAASRLADLCMAAGVHAGAPA
jgi:UDP-N-acetylglucosamine--N-acetylmuramyl-(pentapeptide) pyrophosphoryl-undecaprenol N-acetylglucosamine transferase